MDRFRALWDFDDLDASEARLRQQLDREASSAGRSEVFTQLARVAGLREDFAESERLLQEADALAGGSEVANIRTGLERGRTLRSSGEPAAALPLFELAYHRAVAAGELYLAGDAIHMCALAAGNRTAMEEWTERGLELAKREPAAAYWAGPLLNNLGWAYFDDGEHARALDLFERALEVRRRDPDNQAAIAFAQEAVDAAKSALEGT